VQVKGTAGKVSGRESITSLTFVTNLRVFGPYGRVTGRAFESSPGGEVSGFFGRSGSRLDQIGVITKLQFGDTTPAVIVQGPWGGPHGVPFCSGRGELADIFVTFNKSHVVALQVTYSLGTQAESIKSNCWGGEVGETVKVFVLPFWFIIPVFSVVFLITLDPSHISVLLNPWNHPIRAPKLLSIICFGQASPGKRVEYSRISF